ncbi:MAG: glycosyltransferase [Rickettsiales bacterium]|jgi:glycosyltransferase involved in cell wall biosynthesis|nr:glycosyltransferase [Rickettsiales bacterium]
MGKIFLVVKMKSAEKIIIGIPTYKRPESLRNTLKSILQIIDSDCKNTEIAIIDNDKEKSAFKTYEDIKKFSKKIPIHYFNETKNGLSNVRNRILKEAINLNGNLLLGVDDDEIVEKNWLKNHLKFLNQKDCVVSSGPSISILPQNCPKWVIKGNFFKMIDEKKDKRKLKTCATNNFGLKLDFIKKNNIKFDLLFNNCGGEDTDFFKTIHNKGGNIYHNKNALCYDMVPPERCTLKYVLKRDFRIGNNRALKAKKYNPAQVPLKLLQNTGALLFYIALLPIGIFQKHTFYKNLCKISKTFGYFKGATGKAAKAYGE